MKKNSDISRLNWAVVMTCTVKNGGEYESYKETIAVFRTFLNAEVFIEKCLPTENKDKFEIVSVYY